MGLDIEIKGIEIASTTLRCSNIHRMLYSYLWIHDKIAHGAPRARGICLKFIIWIVRVCVCPPHNSTRYSLTSINRICCTDSIYLLVEGGRFILCGMFLSVKTIFIFGKCFRVWKLDPVTQWFQRIIGSYCSKQLCRSELLNGIEMLAMDFVGLVSCCSTTF